MEQTRSRAAEGRAVQAQAGDVLGGQRAALGLPWIKDHMIAFAATITAN